MGATASVGRGAGWQLCRWANRLGDRRICRRRGGRRRVGWLRYWHLVKTFTVRVLAELAAICDAARIAVTTHNSTDSDSCVPHVCCYPAACPRCTARHRVAPITRHPHVVLHEPVTLCPSPSRKRTGPAERAVVADVVHRARVDREQAHVSSHGVVIVPVTFPV